MAVVILVVGVLGVRMQPTTGVRRPREVSLERLLQDPSGKVVSVCRTFLLALFAQVVVVVAAGTAEVVELVVVKEVAEARVTLQVA